ncbi:hypothetical protein SAMN05661096_04042 [Marivirga sericea]|uniref:Uncharacterized protein n=2 Tax=Marivirga sericea TaxID=1028 RepID=A0A1X7LGQ4_9BACT|nr:hypothetical protein SAMN05661096_04042 [Marivirga sericea]
MEAKQIAAYFFIFSILSSFSLVPAQLGDVFQVDFISLDLEMETEEKAEEGSNATEEMLSSITTHFFGFDNFAFAYRDVNILSYHTHLKTPDIPPEVSSFS